MNQQLIFLLFRYGYCISIKRYVHPLAGWLVVNWLVNWSIRHAAVTEVMQQIWDGITANYHSSLYGLNNARCKW